MMDPGGRVAIANRPGLVMASAEGCYNTAILTWKEAKGGGGGGVVVGETVMLHAAACHWG